MTQRCHGYVGDSEQGMNVPRRPERQTSKSGQRDSQSGATEEKKRASKREEFRRRKRHNSDTKKQRCKKMES